MTAWKVLLTWLLAGVVSMVIALVVSASRGDSTGVICFGIIATAGTVIFWRLIK